MAEAELYPPVKRYLEQQGYEVKGEVGRCDVVARRGDELLVVELKHRLNLEVLLQVVERKALTDAVYVGVPAQTQIVRRRRREVTKLLRMLGLGLLLIDVASGTARARLDPSPYEPKIVRRRRDRLLKEFDERVGDPNTGGQARRGGLVTAYRQKALRVARLLSQVGPTPAREVASRTQVADARTLMYRNVYGWFERAGRGVYQLSPRGERELTDWVSRLERADEAENS